MKFRQCSETSEYKIQTPENYPEENIQHSEIGKSLKPRTLILRDSQLSLMNLQYVWAPLGHDIGTTTQS